MEKLYITYSDELGYKLEEVDEYGISFCDGKAYFNDKTVDISAIRYIQKGKMEN